MKEFVRNIHFSEKE